ncbi:glycosyltransferase [Paenibacillus harenae]|uniref:glycosyltransferase n=1 Tax=Paenibacillus harenae TaxID=306543 RepID=UPI002790F7C3|nr:glycosyltransferase [Paenibacillus harenae]MDQ0062048.1 GT2 family glycosyltransferase [Paenibacillus harenae]
MLNKQLIRQYIEMGKLEEANEIISKLEQQKALDIEIISMKVVTLIMQQELSEALEWTSKGLRENHTYSDLLYNRGYILQQIGELHKAKEYYNLSIETGANQELEESVKSSLDSVNQQLSERGIKQKPLVSIVLLAYNHIDYTKLCVESILRYTSHINYELILVNNGSSDGTRELFDSITDAKVRHLSKNVGPVNGFNEGIEAAEGKYIACVCNDFIFTPRWMDNLLACIESDETIGFVSPGASFVSNHQSISGSYTNIGEMLNFAEQYNKSDSSKWEERVRLLPCVLMVRAKLFREIGKYDPHFYFGEFADDDISFRIRRAGYKLVYCKDTFTYHFGSITTKDDQINNNSLSVSRQLFIDKHGLDVWVDGVFSSLLLDGLKLTTQRTPIAILGVHTKCGANPLQLKNRLKEQGVLEVGITNYCIDSKYMADLRSVSNYVFEGDIAQLKNKLDGVKYDYIIFEHHIDIFKSNPFIIEHLIQLLTNDGEIGLLIKLDREDTPYLDLVRQLEQQECRINYSILEKEPLNSYNLIITAQRSITR